MASYNPPPPNIPRIIKVLDPGDGFYSIQVRMPAKVASQFPSKPWLTPIGNIGLPPNEAALYPGYQLIAIEQMTSSETDLLWIFEKLDGPKWTTKSLGQDSLIPQKYRRLVTRTETRQDVVPTTLPSTIEGDLVSSIVKQEENSGKATKVDVEETIEESADPLEGSQMFGQHGGGIAETLETVVQEGEEEADSGFDVLSSSIDPFGNGKAAKRTVRATEDYPELEGQNYDPKLNIAVPFTQQTVPAGTQGQETDEITPIDQWKSQLRSVDIDRIREALLEIHHIFPTQDTVNLPNTLKSVTAIISRTVGNSNSIGVGSSYSMSNTSSVSVSADFDFELEEGYKGSTAAEVHSFYMEGNATNDDILDRCEASEWPKYNAVSQRIVIAGHGIQKTLSHTSSQNGASISEQSSVNAFVNAVSLPAALCSGVAVGVRYIDHTPPKGAADTLVTKAINNLQQRINGLAETEGASTPQGQQTLSLLQQVVNMGQDLNASSFPVTVSRGPKATTPGKIQKGRFLKSARVQEYGYGMVLVTATVVTVD